MKKSALLLLTLAPLILSNSCRLLREEEDLLEPGRPPAERTAEPVTPEEAAAEPARGRERPPAPRRATGRVTSETLNIRSGPNINYEILGRLGRGDTVFVLSTRFEWHEIELPQEAKGWIHSDYVRLQSQFVPGRRLAGTVTGSTVNVRAMPGTGFSVLAQVKRNERVVVVDKEGDWLGIETARLASGWVHSQHIELAGRP